MSDDFTPSPALTAAEKKAKRLRRNAANASMFSPRLRHRAALANLNARRLHEQEMEDTHG